MFPPNKVAKLSIPIMVHYVAQWVPCYGLVLEALIVILTAHLSPGQSELFIYVLATICLTCCPAFFICHLKCTSIPMST